MKAKCSLGLALLRGISHHRQCFSYQHLVHVPSPIAGHLMRGSQAAPPSVSGKKPLVFRIVQQVVSSVCGSRVPAWEAEGKFLSGSLQQQQQQRDPWQFSPFLLKSFTRAAGLVLQAEDWP